MVTLQTAENALKTVYLGVVSDQLNINANPLLSKIKHSNADVWGKEIRKLAPFGINGGIGAGTEDGALPKASGNKYVQFVSTLKNLYGTIEISDKAIRASENNSGAFVNLLNAEMEGLIKASTFNLSRMLYGDGKGILTKDYTGGTTDTDFITVKKGLNNFMEGMVIEFYDVDGECYEVANSPLVVTSIERDTGKVHFNKKLKSNLNPSNEYPVVQHSFDMEITGLGKIFSNDDLYGVSRATNAWMKPYIKTAAGEINDIVIQQAIDSLEENSGSIVDFITCSSAGKRAYQTYLNSFKRNVDVLELKGGYKAISYNGIPLVSDRFINNDEMYLLNTKEFTLHELCDWQWLEGDDGKIIRQIPNHPTYSATLVKYADLICDKPSGQAKISGIAVS